MHDTRKGVIQKVMSFDSASVVTYWVVSVRSHQIWSTLVVGGLEAYHRIGIIYLTHVFVSTVPLGDQRWSHTTATTSPPMSVHHNSR